MAIDRDDMSCMVSKERFECDDFTLVNDKDIPINELVQLATEYQETLNEARTVGIDPDTYQEKWGDEVHVSSCESRIGLIEDQIRAVVQHGRWAAEKLGLEMIDHAN